MSTEGGCTSEQLVQQARTQGFANVSKRLIVDWTELGLLDKPTRRPRAGGGSEPAVWSDNQAQLFLVLLDKRRQVKRIATLCNIPVFIWRGWGEDYVPIRQVRRAMRTFSDHFATSSGRAARSTAIDLLDSFGITNPNPAQRDALINIITELTSTPRTEIGAHEQHLTDTLRRAIGPHIATTGLPDVPDLLWAINCRLAAAAALRGDTNTPLPDQLFKAARITYQQTAPAYLRDGIGTFGPATSAERLHELANNACLNLLLELGRHLTQPLPPSSPATKAQPR